MKLLYAEDEPERRRYSLSGAVTDAAERLFDRFYREDTARTQSAGGTGLGLSIARAIMEGEGGGLSARVKPGGTIEFEARWKSART